MYLLISILFFFISFVLFKRYGASLNPFRLNLFSLIFWYQIIIQSFVASILVIHNIDNHYMIVKAGENARYFGWLSVLWTMIMLPVGMRIGSMLYKIRTPPLSFKLYCSKSLQTCYTENDTLIKMIIHAFLFISIFCTVYVYFVIGSVPIFEAFKSPSATVLAVIRIDAGRNFEGNKLIRNLGSILLSQVISYICYGYYKLSKSKSDKIYFLLSLCNAFFAVTYDLAKSPLFIFFIGFLLIKVLLKGHIRKRLFIVSGFIILLGLVGAYILIMEDELVNLLFSYNQGITGRIILSQSAGTYLSFDLFPQNADFIGIRSLSRWIPGIFGMDYSERSSRLLMEYYNPRGVEAGVAGVINSLFIGEAWANFGLIGVILSPFVVGGVIGVVFWFFLTKPKTPLHIGILGYLCLSLWSNITGGFNDFLYPIFPIILIFFLVFVKYLSVFFSISVADIQRKKIHLKGKF